ncbi:plancitoxin-1 isoform X2 [Aplysia californica]|uniref:Plancitoxin-1 isoform X2 n=1 Tax=Aplysia californica TaxID=6500 RepID=A0ABM1VP93_APLCA|nr:plancitoxin-1 isoform X2 [Aplysia californica]
MSGCLTQNMSASSTSTMDAKCAFLFVLCFSTGFCLQCLDNDGKAVDWYSVYKYPRVRSPKSLIFKEGLAFVYLDVRNPQWELSKTPINATGNAVYNTLQQIYKSKGESIMYMMYNDEHPEGLETDHNGHTKGVVAFDRTSGFWMIHSSPKFPPARKFSYNWTAHDNGQTVLCISFPFKQLQNIGTQLLYNEPTIYDYVLPADFARDFPVLKKVIDRQHPLGPPWSSVLKLSSLGGETFVSFAKSYKFGADLYDALVAPTLKNDLLVETWLRTEGTKLPSNCSAHYKVFKVTGISLPGPVFFKETKDHAKWAASYVKNVSNMSSVPWTCIGDINRMESQFHRGGGTVCLQNLGMWKAFNNSVNSFDSCH